ncbi:MAG: hypothetical protein EBY26_00175 [Microbacteriaceae bacterium]|nr:hypothetical protein [Microbacteriaceae bacterium]
MNTPTSITQVESNLKLQRLAQLLERVNRVLVDSDNLQVKVKDCHAPAYSDGESITLSSTQINADDLSGSLMAVYGLNYHEVAHILYTPRIHTYLRYWVKNHACSAAFNMLEDQRIETLLVGRYPAVAPYLTNTVLRWLAEDESMLASNYPLTRGRKYLPTAVRQAFRDAYTNPELIQEFNEIIDAYRLLVFPKDEEVAKPLIEAYARLLSKASKSPKVNDCGSDTSRMGDPVSTEEQEQDRDNRQDNAEDKPSESETNNPSTGNKPCCSCEGDKR